MFGSFFDKGSSHHQDPLAQEGFDLYKDQLNQLSPGLMSMLQGVVQNPYYQGDLSASVDPYMSEAYGMIGDYTNNMFGNSQAMMDNILGQMGQFDNYGQMLADYNTRISDPNAAFDYANQFANSGMVNDMIDAASTDVTRNLYENTLPGLDRAAVMRGNTNSNRTGIAEGIATRGAADRIADIGAGIRNNMFGQGINQFNKGSAAELAGLQQMGSAYNNMAGLYNNAFTMGGNALDAMYGMGNSMMGIDQAALDRLYGDYQYGTSLPFDLFGKYMNPYANMSSFSGKGNFQEQPSDADNVAQALKIGSTVAGFF
jgi:hypothetical protein